MTTDLMRSAVPETQRCPGSCNREFRADPDGAEPVWGEPVWCQACVEAIAAAIGALPDLAVDLWDIGHWSVDPVQRVVERVVEVREFTVPFAVDKEGRPVVQVQALLRERLACRHQQPTVLRARIEDLPPPAETRVCWQCAIDDPGADGRVMPGPATARKGPRLVGSPAGSASYLAIDELVMWATRQVDYLKERLPHGSTVEAPDPLAGDDAARARALSTSCAFLVEWIYHLLATPHAQAIGREALDLERRARRSAGVDHPPPAALPGVPCPKCDLVSLRRAGHDPDLIMCASCGAFLSDKDLDQ